MSNIGKLYEKKVMDGDKEVITYSGSINTLKISLPSIYLEDNKFASSDRAPDFRIWLKNSNGTDTQIGVAWKKEIKRGEKAGGFLISIVIDDPSFADKLNVTAFRNDQGHWDIVWNRPRQPEEAA